MTAIQIFSANGRHNKELLTKTNVQNLVEPQSYLSKTNTQKICSEMPGKFTYETPTQLRISSKRMCNRKMFRNKLS